MYCALYRLSRSYDLLVVFRFKSRLLLRILDSFNTAGCAFLTGIGKIIEQPLLLLYYKVSCFSKLLFDLSRGIPILVSGRCPDYLNVCSPVIPLLPVPALRASG
jgi:hypothetical protein